MATLRLDVRCADLAAPIGLVAELRSVDEVGRSRMERRFAVVAGSEHRIEDLAPGTWEVRVLAPAGPTVSGEVDLAAGGDELITLRVAQARATTPVRRSSPREDFVARPRPSTGSLSARSTSWGDGLRGGESAARGTRRGLRAIALQVEPERPEEPRDAVERWRSLARCVDGQISPRKALAARETRVAVKSRLGEPVELRFDEVARPDRRIFAMVEHAHGRRLHAVPAPFRTHLRDDVVRLRANLDPHGGLRSGIELGEPTYAGIVAYLASGAVVAAAELAQDAIHDLTTQALRDKQSSPIGACAAAYVLIGSGEVGTGAPWRDWIGNLRRWFPEVPDGAVLEARLRLLTASTGEQIAEVAALLREAVARGLPFYAVGIGWLIQSLRHFPDDALLAEALPWIERVAAAVDMDEPFTTLRVGEDR